MEAHAREHDDVYLRKIVIRDPKRAPIAKQHGIGGVPHLVLFVNGRRSVTGTNEVLTELSDDS